MIWTPSPRPPWSEWLMNLTLRGAIAFMAHLSPIAPPLVLSPRRPLSYRGDAEKVARIKQPFPHTFDQPHIGVKGRVVRAIRCDGQGPITNGPEQLSHGSNRFHRRDRAMSRSEDNFGLPKGPSITNRTAPSLARRRPRESKVAL